MKKISIIIAAAALVAACQDYSYETYEPETTFRRTGEVSLLATFENLSTKVSMDDDGHGIWDQGDRIAVACSDGRFVDFTLDGTGDTRRAVFKGTIPEGTELGRVAVYPASAAVSLDGDRLTLELSGQQSTGSQGYPGILVAPIGETWEVDFKQALAFLSLTLSNYPTEAVRIRFSGEGFPLSGTFTASIDDIL